MVYTLRESTRERGSVRRPLGAMPGLSVVEPEMHQQLVRPRNKARILGFRV